jgi:hypothetical protein
MRLCLCASLLNCPFSFVLCIRQYEELAFTNRQSRGRNGVNHWHCYAVHTLHKFQLDMFHWLQNEET